MSSLVRIVRSASALWPFYLGVLLTATITALVSLVAPFLTREATDVIVETVQSGGDTAGALRTVLLLALALFIADATKALFNNIGGYIGDVMVSRLRQILSNRHFAKLLALPQG